MNACPVFSTVVLLWLAVPLASAARAEGAAPGAAKDLLGLGRGVEKRLTAQFGAESQASAARSQDASAPGMVITIQPGKADYPGMNLKPEGAGPWDLSAFGHVEARVVNVGTRAALFALRVDNAGDWHDNPWNTEQVYLKPGQRATVTVIFGHHYGHQPGYALKAKEVVNILMFTGKVDAVTCFRVESLVAGGPAGERPPVDPASLRIKPKNGALLGSDVKTAPKVEAKGGVKGWLFPSAGGGSMLRIEFPSANGEQSVALKPSVGRWDLRDAVEVRVKLKNEGTTPVTPSIQVTSDGGATDLITAAPMPAGTSRQIVVPFAPAVTFKGVHATKPGYYGAGKARGPTLPAMRPALSRSPSDTTARQPCWSNR